MTVFQERYQYLLNNQQCKSAWIFSRNCFYMIYTDNIVIYHLYMILRNKKISCYVQAELFQNPLCSLHNWISNWIELIHSYMDIIMVIHCSVSVSVLQKRMGCHQFQKRCIVTARTFLFLKREWDVTNSRRLGNLVPFSTECRRTGKCYPSR